MPIAPRKRIIYPSSSTNRLMDPLQKFADGIKKSGYVLEHKVGKILEDAGWSVLSNRYFIDDTQETVREIDLIAYKVSKLPHLSVYTSLIISCKKSERPWALLSKLVNPTNPNIDWTPLHIWTNDAAVGYMLHEIDAAGRYHDDARKIGGLDSLRNPTWDVFAVQEMDPKTGDPKNDSKIFDSLSALMKAQSYEIQALPTRVTGPAVYQFNLLSVLDGQLIRLEFDEGEISPSSVKSDHYIVEYIVRKQRSVSRIRFIQADNFLECLHGYDKLHHANVDLLSRRSEEFYQGVFKNSSKTAVFIKEFRHAVGGYLSRRLNKHLRTVIDLSDINVGWDEQDETVTVHSELLTQEAATFLNNHGPSRQHVALNLMKYFRFQGPFKFVVDDDDIPF